jgi:hypothetical protein
MLTFNDPYVICYLLLGWVSHGSAPSGPYYPYSPLLSNSIDIAFVSQFSRQAMTSCPRSVVWFVSFAFTRWAVAPSNEHPH